MFNLNIKFLTIFFFNNVSLNSKLILLAQAFKGNYFIKIIFAQAIKCYNLEINFNTT